MIVMIWKVVKILFIIGVIYAILIGILPNEKEKYQKNREKYEKKILQYIKEYLGINAYHHLVFSKNGDDNDTSEIDITFATKKGVFCIECKYTTLSTKPTISLSFDRWDMGNYNYLNNPFNQNETHIEWLKECLRDVPSLQQNPITFYNIVCVDFGFIFKRFVSEYDSDKNPYVSIMDEKKMLLTTRYKNLAEKAFSSLGAEMSNMPDVLTESEVKEINDILASHVVTKEQL